MNLREYFDLKVGNASALAIALEIPHAYLWQMAEGIKPVKPQRCIAIEKLTDGVVRREHLRDDWREIWPERAAEVDGPKRKRRGSVPMSPSGDDGPADVDDQQMSSVVGGAA